MPIKLALILSVLLQCIAAIIAFGLIRRTRKNVAWWLISIGFLLMAIRRAFELFILFESENPVINGLLSSWIGVGISLTMLISLIFIKQIFDIQKKNDELRESNESNVLSAIIRTEESERQRFAKDLHDGLGPLLSAVKISLSVLKRKPFEQKDIEIIGHTDMLIAEAITSLRETSNNLSPHILQNFGIAKALQSFIMHIKGSIAPKIELNTNVEDKRFNYTIEIVLYRVSCELIANSLRHAEAKHINIDLFEQNGLLQFDYYDDGQGFEPSLLSQQGEGMGHQNIRSRIKSINGSLDINSKPGEGVSIRIIINTMKDVRIQSDDRR